MISLVVRLALVLLCTCCFIGCDNSSGSHPQSYLIYTRDNTTNNYQLIQSPIATLRDLDRLDGDIAYLRGGGKIVVGNQTERTENALLNALKITDASPIDLEYTIDNQGVVIPWDFDSAMMLTLYHHLENAAHYFESIGVEHSVIGRVPVYYFPTLTVFGIPLSIFFSDNAAYAFTLDAFIIPPRLLLRDVPLSANMGVIIHEYSHAVFNRLVHQNRRVPAYLIDDWPTRAVNELTSLDEGLADVFAALALSEPDFISASISEEVYGIDRDLRKERFYDSALFERVNTTSSDTTSGEVYNPYQLGSVIASTLWTLAKTTGKEQLELALIQSMDAISDPDQTFKLSYFFDAIIDSIPSDNRLEACELFYSRLIAIQQELQCRL